MEKSFTLWIATSSICCVLILGFAPVSLGETNHESKQTTTITASVLKDFPPLYQIDQAGKPEGFAIDILQHVAEQAGVEVRYVIKENWAQAMEAVRNGSADLIPGIGISPTRSEEFLFTERIETIPVSCFVRHKNQEIKGIDSLKEHRVAVIGQSAAFTRMNKAGGFNLVAFPNIDSALMKLLAGDVDAFVFPEPVLWKKVRSIGLEEKIKVVGKPLMELKRGFLMRKESKSLKSTFDPLIRSFTQSEAYLDSYVSWYGKPSPYWTATRIFWTMSAILLSSLILFLCWHGFSMSRVNKRLRQSITDLNATQRQVRQLNLELEERVRRRTISLEAANKELDAFAYSVSHDLRAPLRGIDGFSLALLEDYGEQLDDTAKGYLARVRNGCARMGKLIDDLLKMSRLTRTELHRGPIDLTRMANRSLRELTAADPKRKITLEIDEDVTGEGDPTLVQTVLDNLIGNAWKFTEKKERATIAFGMGKTGDQVTYYVQDNGAGFNMDYAEKLFGAFQRLHSPGEFEGTGIGLASVQRIIHRHGGRVWAEAEEDKGATFYFTLE